MLQGPYGELTRLIQDSLVSFSGASIFSSELEHGLEIQGLLTQAPIGLIWDRGANAGAPLSRMAEFGPGAREHYDDLVPGQAGPKSDLLRALAENSKSLSIAIHSKDPVVWHFAHFLRRPDGRLATVLSEAAPAL